MVIEIFGKPNCGRCITAQNKVGHFLNKWGLVGRISVNFFDMETVNGRAEGAFYDVIEVPTVIIRDGERNVARWDGKVPKAEEMRLHLQGGPDDTPS